MSQSESSQPSPFRRILWRHSIASYAWSLAYLPYMIQLAFVNPPDPTWAAFVGIIIGLIASPLGAPAILIAAPIAALVQHRPMMLPYYVGLALYIVTFILLIRRDRKRANTEP